MDTFARAWKLLEAKGWCDAFGGAEYTRIRRGWTGPIGVMVAMDFIRSISNTPAINVSLPEPDAAAADLDAADQFSLIPDPLELPNAPGELPLIPPDLPPVPEN
jgi:hypothetical protein